MKNKKFLIVLLVFFILFYFSCNSFAETTSTSASNLELTSSQKEWLDKLIENNPNMCYFGHIFDGKLGYYFINISPDDLSSNDVYFYVEQASEGQVLYCSSRNYTWYYFEYNSTSTVWSGGSNHGHGGYWTSMDSNTDVYLGTGDNKTLWYSYETLPYIANTQADLQTCTYDSILILPRKLRYFT